MTITKIGQLQAVIIVATMQHTATLICYIQSCFSTDVIVVMQFKTCQKKNS